MATNTVKLEGSFMTQHAYNYDDYDNQHKNPSSKQNFPKEMCLPLNREEKKIKK